jgi:hypothetical protein
VKTKLPAVLEVYPKFKENHLPPWLLKTVKSTAEKEGLLINRANLTTYCTDSFPGLWQHWGSDGKILITQPLRETSWVTYEGIIRVAKKFAEKYSLEFQAQEFGLWSPRNCLIVFQPSVLSVSSVVKS